MLRKSNLYILAMMHLTQVNCVGTFVYSIANLADSVKNIYPRSGLAIVDVMLFGSIMYNYKYNAKDGDKPWKMPVNIASMILCGLALVCIYMNIFSEIVFMLLQTIHIVNVLIFDIDNKEERITFAYVSLCSAALSQSIYELLDGKLSSSILIIISVVIMFCMLRLLANKTSINKALIARIGIMHIILLNICFGINEIKGLILITGCCADIMLSFWALHVKMIMLEISAYNTREKDVIWEVLGKGLRILCGLLVMVILILILKMQLILILGALMKSTVPIGKLLTLIEVGIMPITIGIVLGVALGVVLGVMNLYQLKRLKATAITEATPKLYISLLIWVLVVIMLIIKFGLTMSLSITIGIALGALTLATIIDVESTKT